jgi:hypothetical protein
MTVTQKELRSGGFPTPSPVPSLVSTSVTMVQGDTLGPYTLYSASSLVSSTIGVKYGVISGQFSDMFKDAAELGDTCEIIDASPLSSSLSYS